MHQNTPIVQTKISKSEDGRFIVHKTIITDIKPAEYYKAIMQSPAEDYVTEEDDLKEKK